MARGRGGSHKGGRKQFTNPEELAARQEREERQKAWRRQRGEDEDEEEEDKEESEEESEEEEEESSEGEDKPKGVQSLIQVENPNRIQKKAQNKPDTVDPSSKVELSRREREELEKQKAREHYAKLHAEGKTEQARADLARLALIRRQREEAAAKKKAEQQKKEGESKNAAALKAVKSVVSEVTAAPTTSAGAEGGITTKKKTGKK